MIENLKYAGVGRLRLFSIGRYLPPNDFISIEIEASVWEINDNEEYNHDINPDCKYVILISRINPNDRYRYKQIDIAVIVSSYFDSVSCICPFVPSVCMELRVVSMSLEQILCSMTKFFGDIMKSPNTKAMFSCNEL